MEIVQWIVAAGTAAFVATTGFFQWRTAQQKAVLDLFDRRHEIYEVVRVTVGHILRNSTEFQHKEDARFSCGVGTLLFLLR